MINTKTAIQLKTTLQCQSHVSVITVMHRNLLKETTKVAANTEAAPDRNIKQVIFRNCAPFIVV